MGRKKRPIRNIVFLFIFGMSMIMTALMFDAKAATPDTMARCYGLASASGNHAAAKRLRLELRPLRVEANEEITYTIGYTKGYLDAHADSAGVPISIVATNLFNKEC